VKAKVRKIQEKRSFAKKNQTKIRKENNKVIVSFEFTEEKIEMMDALRKENPNGCCC
jgi:hypothetical protein